MSVTIYDVAERAGVSTATVSKVLSNKPYVRAETRSKVLDAVEALGYAPNLAAKGLSQARTFVIGLAFPYASDYLFSDPHLMTFLRGVGQIAAENNYNILLTPARDQDDAASGLRYLLNTQYVDGAIVAGMRAVLEAGADLPDSGFPIVTLGYHSPNPPENTVHADNRRGALQVTRHLLALNHKHIGVINAKATLTDLDERLAGYQQALEEYRIPFKQDLIAYGDFTEKSGAQAAEQLLARSPRPTAIFAFNDRMAVGAMQYVKKIGLRVPQDIAVVGFDDIPLAAMVEPPLTTVRQPALEMGKTAARMLFALIDGKIDHFPEAILPALLIVRESCGSKRPA